MSIKYISISLLFFLVVVFGYTHESDTPVESASIILSTTDTNRLTDGLVAHYTFDGPDMLQNVADVSGQGNHGQLVNFTSTTTAPGKHGQALEFDGGNGIDVGDIGDVDGASQLTISAWIWQDSLKDESTILTKWTGAGEHFFFGVQDRCAGPLRMYFDESPTIFACPDTNNHLANTWEHWTLVFDGTLSGNANRVKMYKNGVQVSLGFNGTFSSTLPSNSDSLAIGDDLGGTFGWNGSLDDVRLYNRALSATEITDLYALGR